MRRVWLLLAVVACKGVVPQYAHVDPGVKAQCRLVARAACQTDWRDGGACFRMQRRQFEACLALMEVKR